MKNKPKIIICEDHDITLYGLNSILKANKNIEVIGTYNDSEKLIKSISNLETDIIISDLEMPEYDGFELMKLVKKIKPDIKFIICTMHINKWTLVKLQRKNVNSIISKNSVLTDLNIAIENVIKGELYFSDDIKNALSEKKTNLTKYEEIPLTVRENEILNLIAKELSSQQIADKLKLSINTIETHRKNLFLKFEVKNVVGLIKKAIQKGMV